MPAQISSWEQKGITHGVDMTGDVRHPLWWPVSGVHYNVPLCRWCSILANKTAAISFMSWLIVSPAVRPTFLRRDELSVAPDFVLLHAPAQQCAFRTVVLRQYDCTKSKKITIGSKRKKSIYINNIMLSSPVCPSCSS